MIDDKEFDEAVKVCNEVIDFADGDNIRVIGFALTMAAASAFVSAGIEIGEAARLLRLLMKVKQEEENATEH